MTRPTIRDLAEASGVSVSTVNRVLAGAPGVRDATSKLVKEAAERIGFYGLGAIRAQIISRRTRYRFGFLLLQPGRTYYKMLAAAITEAARLTEHVQVEPVISFAEDLSPQYTAARLHELGQTCQAVAIVAAVHPILLTAVETVQQSGVPVFAMISQLGPSIGYIGPDNWKAGRTAAWLIANVNKTPGKVGILVGNHRFRCQEMNESGFRSYFREFAPEFTLLEPLSTFETSAVAEEMTEKLLTEHPDLAGLFVAGGGISGVIQALRSTGHAGRVITVGHQLMDNTREALLDRTLSLVLHDHMDRMAADTIAAMIRAQEEGPGVRAQHRVLPFEIFTQENV